MRCSPTAKSCGAKDNHTPSDARHALLASAPHLPADTSSLRRASGYRPTSPGHPGRQKIVFHIVKGRCTTSSTIRGNHTRTCDVVDIGFHRLRRSTGLGGYRPFSNGTSVPKAFHAGWKMRSSRSMVVLPAAPATMQHNSYTADQPGNDSGVRVCVCVVRQQSEYR